MTKPDAVFRRLGGVRSPLPLLLFGFVLVTAACSAAPAASGPAGASAPVPTPPVSSTPSVAADYTGVLSFDEIEGGCTYLATADGK
jgi:hypothetical protein